VAGYSAPQPSLNHGAEACSPPFHGCGQRRYPLAQFVGDFLAAFQSVFGNFFCVVFPVVQCFARVLVSASQFFAHLFSRLRRKQKSNQRPGSQPDQQKSDRGCGGVSFGRLIFSYTHKSSSLVMENLGMKLATWIRQTSF
jgi:hypothetical protein